MKYSPHAIEMAESILSERRNDAEKQHTERLQEIAENAPEIYRMNNEALGLNYALIGSIGKGGEKKSISESIAAIRERNLTIRHNIRAMLEACGYPGDYLQYHYVCEKCRDTGYHEGVRCDCMKKLLKYYTTEEINERCSIELHDFSEFRVELYSNVPSPGGEIPREKMRTLFDFCRKYAEHFDENSRSLFFFGRTGLGKTFLSSCIAKKLIEDDRNVVYGSLLKLLRQIEDERFHRASGDTTGVLLDADLVILDDLGSEFQTQFTDAVIYEILNERINNRRPTIISTNLTTKELDRKYNDRIVSRITGCFIPCAFLGSDVRLEKMKKGIV
ncbi:ATP-binding protein [uncultured Ruminococcus sp.]|uniref:ATP-binding protein n=1 Tax=uncultured Ruminococcus sp. TaxID=165186 RepID=UPI0025D1AB13|nr:ATP-binding protein [uncultured Ruminococcus sp.]